MLSRIYLGHTWLIALLLTIPFIIFLPLEFNRYRLEIQPTGNKLPDKYKLYYHDLNGDGELEKIHSFPSQYDLFSFQVFEIEGGLYDQWNYPGKYHMYSKNLFFSDIDNNGTTEILGFTLREDSVYLNYYEPFGPNPRTPVSFFIDRIPTKSFKEFDFHISIGDFADFDLDSYEEFVFVIHSGYSLEPRKIYSYNFQTNKLISSPRAGMSLSKLHIEDIDNDGKPEVFGMQKSEFNIPPDYEIPYTDHHIWFMVYDDDLNYLFPPVQYPETFAYNFVESTSADLIPGSKNKKEENYLITLFSPYRKSAGKPILRKFSPTGEILVSDTLDYIYSNFFNKLIKLGENRIAILGHNGKIFELDENLKVRKTLNISSSPLEHYLHLEDLNNDGTHEILIKDLNHNRLLAISNNLRHISEADIDLSDRKIGQPIQKGEQTVIIVDEEEMLISYRINPNAYFRIPSYLGIYLVLYLLVFGLRKIQEARLREQYELDAQIRSLEINAFRNQLDPHFTFNVFNIVASLIKKGDQQQAMDAFMKFSKLIRKNLETFDEITRSLGEELETARNFLDINKLRYPDRFDYSIETGENIPQTVSVPKMIILTHIENAVKHGLRSKSRGGHISIKIQADSVYLNLSVEDNGSGRQGNNTLPGESTGMGLRILDKTIDHLNRSIREKITQSITDLKDDSGEAAGTRVDIRIPLGLNE
ncbi:MAG TPA: hypothetical protein ENI20_11865 [Bacteroides sp.]|nr:hypothetical protein [Bacteroides sp.]